MGGSAFRSEHESGNRLLLKYFLQELQEFLELINLVLKKELQDFCVEMLTNKDLNDFIAIFLRYAINGIKRFLKIRII